MTRIGVGIVGLSAHGGWASRAHLPALRALPELFAVTGLCGSTPDAAAAAGAAHGVPFHTADPAALAAHPDVDLVLVSVKVPEHDMLVRAAIAAGKAVLCEWPLARDHAEAEELAGLAKRRGVQGWVGLQGRHAPAILALRRLLAGERCGDILGMNILGRLGLPWDGTTDSARTYLNRRASGATMLSIPVGHLLGTLTHLFGDLDPLSATLAQSRPWVTLTDTGETIATDVADQIVVGGRLAAGPALALHYRGGLGPAGNFRWEINGSKADLLLTGGDGHSQFGMMGLTLLKPGRAPEEIVAPGRSGAMVKTMTASLLAIHQAMNGETGDAPTFADAVRLHALLARIEEAAARL